MKKSFLLYTLLLSMFYMGACKKDSGSTSVVTTNPGDLGVPGSVITVDTLRQAYSNLSAQAVVLDNYKINGVVISDAASGNFIPGFVIIQDGKKGITLSLSETEAAAYKVGDSLQVAVTGDTLTNKLGTLVLAGVKADSIQTLATGVTVAPTIVTLLALQASFEDYESILVKVVNASLNPTPAATDTYNGDKYLTDITATTTVMLHTESTATWANELVPAMGTFTVIPAFYNSDGDNTNIWASKRLLLRSLNDVKAVSVIAGWQFGSPSSAGNEASFTANTVSSSLVAPVLTRGNGWNTAALARGFSSNAAYIIKTRDDAYTYNSYYQFALTVKTTETMTLNSINSHLRRSSAGANVYHWAYSLDGTNFTDVGSADIALTSTDDGGVEQSPIDLTEIDDLKDIPAGTTVTFRLYAWGFSNVGSGTFALGRFASGVATNCLSVTGLIQ